MKINGYSFGKIVVDGTTYTSDLILYPGRVDASWWRREGHNLCLDDLTDILAAKPGILIIGTGDMGVMKVPETLVTRLREKGIDVRIARTGQAVEMFNSLSGSAGVVAALHLTC